MQHHFPTHLCLHTHSKRFLMEAKVKGTLNYHGNLNDFPASKGDETFSWLMESTWWESTVVVIGLLFLSMFTFSSQALWWGRKRKENNTWAKPGAGGRNAVVQSQWPSVSVKKDRVTTLTDLKETQLSNPQKYKSDFPLGGGRRRLRGFG